MQFSQTEQLAIAKVRTFLDDQGADYEYFEHSPTPTSQDAANIRGMNLEEGVKAIVLRGKKSGKNYMFCFPSHLKLNMKKMKEEIGEAASFEDPQVLKDQYGLIIGGVPPLGFLFGIETYYDSGVFEGERTAFNCGSQSGSIVLHSKELWTAVQTKLTSAGAYT